MTTALYRRYRPETFAEMIGQSQVTEPLMTALRSDRVGHAYLFSGPRGCGKTTSARILARCLNCAAGPTDTPCGQCASCVELGRGGGGSLDVVEIDAASHNGVDDARDLRERAVFAPARDRFKIFILDEAHMVTPQGFNALLKLVEEPPAHVKFIFATTEPEKVIGTIRSRTHHYPFRLVAPAAMLEYVEQLCGQEGVQVEPGVLPLVVRAGGGSPRDTLSVLDQLIAGSEEATVIYARAVALLGYTPAELLDEVVDAFGARDAAAAFSAVDRVVQTGQDPRRFVDDLLERLRDLIVVAATGSGAAAVLRGVPADELERMGHQARAFGAERLSRVADIVVAALDEMTGATSPRLQLELMVARVLAHGGAASAPAAPAAPVAEPVPQVRGGAPAASAGAAEPGPSTERAPQAPVAAPAPSAGEPATSVPAAAASESGPSTERAPQVPAGTPATPTPSAAALVPSTERAPQAPAGTPATPTPSAGEPAPSTERAPQAPAGTSVPSAGDPATSVSSAGTPDPSVALRAPQTRVDTPPEPAAPAAFAASGGPVTRARIDAAWPEILQRLEGINRTSWLIACTAAVVDFADDVLTLSFASAADVARFKKLQAGSGPSEDLRQAIQAVVGIRVKYIARHGGAPGGGAGGGSAPAPPAPDVPAASVPTGRDTAPRPAAGTAEPRPAAGRATAPAAPAPVTDWAVAPIPPDPGPESAPNDSAPGGFAVDDDPEDAAASPVRTATLAPPREGEVLPPREIVTSLEPDDDEREADEMVAPEASVPVVPPQLNAAVRDDGVERVGEAVVRQVLGATFLREEPYESPTRFS
ncbi:DNA polymerase III subunit gamma and tau [Microbacterium luticocti]|uniref:DNA polymerase III subunit gamma and tau n=1 Tax=Microbacterium luticocti TaxID=451764 RepID=UPI00040AFABA|nr:DNA polymerase III subunit gamma and tau [Microbacterium luticocti]